MEQVDEMYWWVDRWGKPRDCHYFAAMNVGECLQLNTLHSPVYGSWVVAHVKSAT